MLFSLFISLSALFSGGTEAVWVLGARVAVTAPGETHALDTLIAGRAALIRVISAGVTVTAWRERGLALTILGQANVKCVNWGLRWSPCTRLRWDRSCWDPQRWGRSRSPGGDTCTGRSSRQRSRWSPQQRLQGHLNKVLTRQLDNLVTSNTHNHIQGGTWVRSRQRWGLQEGWPRKPDKGMFLWIGTSFAISLK